MDAELNKPWWLQRQKKKRISKRREVEKGRKMPAIRPRNENEPDPIVRCCMDALAGLLQHLPDQATSTLIHIIYPLLSTHHQQHISRASVAKRMAGMRLIGACPVIQNEVLESMIPLALDRMRNDPHVCVRVGACRAICRHLTEAGSYAFCYASDELIRTACEYVLLKEAEDDDVARVDEVREGLRLVGCLIMTECRLWWDDPKIARELLLMCCDFIVKSVQQEEVVMKVKTKMRKMKRGCEAMMALQECAKGMVNNLAGHSETLEEEVMPIITHTFVTVLGTIKIIGPTKLMMKVIKSMVACVLAMAAHTPPKIWHPEDRCFIRLHLDSFVPLLRDALPELMVDEETKEMMKKIEMVLQGDEKVRTMIRIRHMELARENIKFAKEASSLCIKRAEHQIAHRQGRGHITILGMIMDCISHAAKLADNGKKGTLLNFANNDVPGGPVHVNCGTQEEQLMKRSTLGASIGLPDEQSSALYPIDKRTLWPKKKYECLYLLHSPQVCCLRDSNYKMLKEPSAPFGVITLAATEFPATQGDQYKLDEDKEITRRKIRMILGATEGILVIGECGTSAFCNPLEIVDLWVEEISRTDVHAVFCAWQRDFYHRLKTVARRKGILSEVDAM